MILRLKNTPTELNVYESDLQMPPTERKKSTLISALIGGALGAGLSSNHRVIGGVAGAGLGALAMHLLNNSVDKSNEERKEEAKKVLKQIKRTGYQILNVPKEDIEKYKELRDTIGEDDGSLTHSYYDVLDRMYNDPINKGKF